MQAFHEQLVYPDTCRLRAGFNKGIDFLAHWHEEAELIFVIEGQQRIGINNRVITLTAGQIALVAPLDIHYYEKCGEIKGYMLIFAPELVNRQFLEHSGCWQIRDTAQLAVLADLSAQLVKEMQERQPFFELAATGLLRLIFTRLFRPDQAVQYERLDQSRPQRFQTLRGILDYLETHYRESLPRAEVARRFNLSVAHLSRLFKAATGMTLAAYLTSLRLESAYNEIVRNDRTILAIALDNGFESIRTFNRIFRKVYRRTPASLRR